MFDFAINLFLVLGCNLNHDIITVSCLLFGFAYGTTGFVEEKVYRDAVGVRQWRKVEGPLEVLTGIFVILAYYIIYRLDLTIMYILTYSYVIYLFVLLLWLCLLLIDFIKDF